VKDRGLTAPQSVPQPNEDAIGGTQHLRRLVAIIHAPCHIGHVCVEVSLDFTWGEFVVAVIDLSVTVFKRK